MLRYQIQIHPQGIRNSEALLTPSAPSGTLQDPLSVSHPPLVSNPVPLRGFFDIFWTDIHSLKQELQQQGVSDILSALPGASLDLARGVAHYLSQKETLSEIAKMFVLGAVAGAAGKFVGSAYLRAMGLKAIERLSAAQILSLLKNPYALLGQGSAGILSMFVNAEVFHTLNQTFFGEMDANPTLSIASSFVDFSLMHGLNWGLHPLLDFNPFQFRSLAARGILLFLKGSLNVISGGAVLSSAGVIRASAFNSLGLSAEDLINTHYQAGAYAHNMAVHAGSVVGGHIVQLLSSTNSQTPLPPTGEKTLEPVLALASRSNEESPVENLFVFAKGRAKEVVEKEEIINRAVDEYWGLLNKTYTELDVEYLLKTTDLEWQHTHEADELNLAQTPFVEWPADYKNPHLKFFSEVYDKINQEGIAPDLLEDWIEFNKRDEQEEIGNPIYQSLKITGKKLMGFYLAFEYFKAKSDPKMAKFYSEALNIQIRLWIFYHKLKYSIHSQQISELFLETLELEKHNKIAAYETQKAIIERLVYFISGRSVAGKDIISLFLKTCEEMFEKDTNARHILEPLFKRLDDEDFNHPQFERLKEIAWSAWLTEDAPLYSASADTIVEALINFRVSSPEDRVSLFQILLDKMEEATDKNEKLRIQKLLEEDANLFSQLVEKILEGKIKSSDTFLLKDWPVESKEDLFSFSKNSRLETFLRLAYADNPRAKEIIFGISREDFLAMARNCNVASELFALTRYITYCCMSYELGREDVLETLNQEYLYSNPSVFRDLITSFHLGFCGLDTKIPLRVLRKIKPPHFIRALQSMDLSSLEPYHREALQEFLREMLEE